MSKPTVKPRRSNTSLQPVMHLLAGEGYRPRLESRDAGLNSIAFEAQDQDFRAQTLDADKNFIRVCTGVALEEGGPDETALLRLGQEVQAGYKGLKVHLPGSLEFVEFQVELLLDGHSLSPALLQLCMGILLIARSDFCKRMKPEAPKAIRRRQGTGTRAASRKRER